MIDPVIFTLNLGELTLEFRWYGLLIMLGVLVGALISASELKRRGGNPDHIWDPIILVIPAAIIGARVWYVLNSILGGNTYYTEDIGRMFRIQEGGLHIFGGLLFGGLAAYWYARTKNLDFRLMLDAIAPGLLIGQAVARPANFINQELYGPPTTLPWGIPIEAPFRINQWTDLALYPVETTRFHPTFAYEMIWNLVMAGILLFLVRKFADKFKPGAAFATWLVMAGIGRLLIEFFRPDQPLVPGLLLSYSFFFSLLMAIAGILWLLIRFEKIKIKGISPGPDSYRLATKKYPKAKAQRNKDRLNQ